ncbi:hypothetical protein IMSAG025_01161 [Muribaculaceae bacterium]|nr:hypothetical protein IMSAG025_01161 [Muribaculaceae bacterium]
MGFQMGFCLAVHAYLDIFQDLSHGLLQFIQHDFHFLPVIPAANHAFIGLNILRSDFHTDRNPPHLLLGEFPSGALIRIVHLHPEPSQSIFQFKGFIQYPFLLLLNRNNHHLGRGNFRRQYQPGIIPMHHNNRSDDTCGHPPGSLMYIFEFIIPVRKLNAKCLGKSIAKIMAGPRLQRLAVMHQCFNRIGCLRPCKFLLIRLTPFHHWNRQNLLTEVRIYVQHLFCSLLGFLRCRMCRMPFLPQKLPGTQERPRLLFPAHHAAPLIINPGQIPVGLDIPFIEIAEQGFRSRPYAHPLLQWVQSAMGHPCHFRGKTLHMVFFLLQQPLRYEHGHIHVLYACSLEHIVQLPLYQLPNRIPCRFDNHTALHIGIIN